MLTDILHRILVHDAVQDDGIGQAGILVPLHLMVRHDAAAVADGTAVKGLELMRQGIGNMSHAAVFVAVAVVDGLYAAAGGRVILRRGHLELAVIRKRPDALYESLAVSAGSDDGGTVQVLQRTGNDFRRRGGTGIHQDDEGDFQVHGIGRGLVFLPGTLGLSLGGHDHGTLGNEQGNDVHRFAHDAAAVAAEIQHQALHSLRFEGMVAVADSLAHPFGELGQEDVSVAVVQHAHIFHGGEGDAFAGDGDVDGFTRLPGSAVAQFLHAENDLGARLAAHLVGALLGGESMGAHSVDGLDLIAADEAGLRRRRARIGLVDHDIAVLVRLVDDRADAAVGIGQHHLEILLFLFRNIDGIGVQGFQHGVHAFPLDPAHFQGVHIRTVEFLQDGIVQFHPLPQGEALGLRGGSRGG